MTWAKGKIWMRQALKELKDKAKLVGQDVSFQANNVQFFPLTKMECEDAREDACEKIAVQMRDSFRSLAQTGVEKAETIDAHAATIPSLTKTIAELIATNK